MNILFYGRFKAGTTHFGHVFELASNLTKLGHNVVFPGKGKGQWNELAATGRASPVKHAWGYPLIILVLLSALGNAYLFVLSIYTILRAKAKFDVIYMRHAIFSGGYLLAKIFGIPSVKEINGVSSVDYRLRYKSRILLSLVEKIEYFNIKKADRIIAVSSGLKDILVGEQNVPERKVVFIENGANVELFQPINTSEGKDKLGLNQDSRYICFVGSLGRYKGIQYLIQSAPLILNKHPEAKFLIVGDGEEKEELEKLTEEAGISDRFIFTGMVPYHKVPLYINASEICVALFTSSRNERIGISPLKVFEYMACGKPMVASNIKGVDKLLRGSKAGVPVVPDDYHTLAEAIIKLLGNEQMRKQMGSSGRKYVVENHSWESVAGRVAEVCESAVKEHKSKKSKL